MSAFPDRLSPSETSPAFDASTNALGNLLIAPRVRAVCASQVTVVPFKGVAPKGPYVGVAVIKQSLGCRGRIV